MANLLAGMVADLSHIGDTNLPYAQLAEEKRQFDSRLNYLKQQDEGNALKELGAYTPTGTTWDSYANKSIQEAKKAFVERRKNNPREKYQQALMSEEVQAPLAKVREYTPIAKANDVQRIELMKNLKAEYPEIDDAQLANYVAQTQYKDGLPNRDWAQEADLSPQTLAQFVIPDKATMKMSEGLKKRFATSPYIQEGDPSKGEPDYIHNIYPFQKVEGNTVVTPKEEVLFAGKPYKVLSPEVEGFLDKSSPSYYSLYGQAAKTVQQDPLFQQMPEDLQDKVINTMVWDATSNSLGAAKPTVDRSRQMAYQQMKAQQLQAQRQADANYIAMRKLNLDERKYADKEKGDTYLGALVKFAEKQPLKEDEQNTLAYRTSPKITNAVLSTMPQEFVSEFKKDPKNQIKAIDLSNNAKNGVLRASDGNFVKSYAWRKGNKEGVVEELWVFNPDTKKYEQDEKETIRVVNTPIKQYLGRFAKQLDPKEKSYFEATETTENAE